MDCAACAVVKEHHLIMEDMVAKGFDARSKKIEAKRKATKMQIQQGKAISTKVKHTCQCKGLEHECHHPFILTLATSYVCNP